MKKDFAPLFIDRNKSVYFDIAKPDSTRVSRIGGTHPDYFDEHALVDKTKYYYFMTIGDEFSSLIDGKCLSVFVRRNVWDIKHIYPEFDILCICHEASQESKNTDLKHPDILEGSLFISEKIPEKTNFIKFGGQPDLIQDKTHYTKALIENGYDFIFQFDEYGYPDDFISGNFPFSFGGVYFYGKPNAQNAQIENILGGFFQFT